MFILDSSAIIEIFHGTETGNKIVTFLEGKMFSVTSFSVYEIFFKEKEKEKLNELISSTDIFVFDEGAAEVAVSIEKNLKKSGSMINDIDIFIAAICMQTNSTLVICDNDFKKISGLDAVFF